MEASYYKEYFELERNHWWFRARKNILRNHIQTLLSPNRKLKILNVGVSTGNSSVMLQEFGEVTSIEYDKDCIDYTKSRLELEILPGSVTDLQFQDNTFDLVCAFDVIEHVEDDQLAVQELFRVCKDGGIVTVTVPAFMSLWSHHDEVNHHFRRYTRKNLTALFAGKHSSLLTTYFNFWMFFLIAPVRFLINLFPGSITRRKGSGSDFSSPLGSNKFVQGLFYRIFKSESYFINRRITFPFGVSLLTSWKK